MIKTSTNGHLSHFFLVNVFAGFIVAGFFEDRKIGFWGVFWLSVLLTPLFGILLGLTSQRVKRKNLTEYEKYQSKKKHLLERIESLKREEELDLLDESKKQLVSRLNNEYKQFDDEKEKERIRRERLNTSIESKRRVRKQYAILFIAFVIVLSAAYYYFNYGNGV